MKNTDEDTILNFEGIDNDIKLGRADFMRMALPANGGELDIKNFGCVFRIGLDGIYVNTAHEDEVDLTPEEAASLCPHPTGNLAEPALKFPFSIRDLESFLAFTNEEGLDVPLSNEAFEQVIAIKMQQGNRIDNSSNCAQDDYLLSLGKATQQRNQEFASRPRDGYDELKAAHQLWIDKAIEIQHSRDRPASNRQLARLVRNALNLDVSEETIRQKFPDSPILKELASGRSKLKK